MKLKNIRQACKITDIIFSKVCKNFSTFRTEFDVKKFIIAEIRKFGHSPSFDIIVASGWHASRPHHKTTKQRLLKGFCVIDFGIRVNGYCSDMTRTIYLGQPSKKEKALYALLLRVQNKSIARLKPGKMYKYIDIASRIMLKGYKKYFIHSLGHGLGKRIHENPRISPKSVHVIKAGDIITIEPGVYKKKKWGLRIEDDVLIKKNKIELLTKSTKKLLKFNQKIYKGHNPN